MYIYIYIYIYPPTPASGVWTHIKSKYAQRSLLVQFVINLARYSFGCSESISAHFRGRILMEQIIPRVRNVRHAQMFRIVASNIVFAWRLGMDNTKQQKNECQNDKREIML